MKKILVIEDNEQARNNIAGILMLANYQVHRAENGKDGISLPLLENFPI